MLYVFAANVCPVLHILNQMVSPDTLLGPSKLGLYKKSWLLRPPCLPEDYPDVFTNSVIEVWFLLTIEAWFLLDMLLCILAVTSL